MDRGLITWVSASGDELQGTYVGSAALDVLDPAQGIAEGKVEMTFVITGGTGRFENATGGGTGSGVTFSREDGLTMEFHGEISSVGSSK